MIHKVDSLNVKIDSLKLQRDTIFSNIDSSKQKIGLIELQYEKDFNTNDCHDGYADGTGRRHHLFLSGL